MRIGIGMFVGAFMAAGAAQAQDTAAQMRAGFDVCADFVAGRADFDGAVAAANALGFVGDGGQAMYWARPGDGMRVRLNLPVGVDSWCSVSTWDPVDTAPLADQAMSWAAERLAGPWRHARQDQPTALDVSAITGFNGWLGVTASRPTRGGVRVMAMKSTAARWDEHRTSLGAQPVTLELPAYVPPAPSAPAGPPLRDRVLSALTQCRAFVDGGDRPAATGEGAGVLLTVSDAPRACAVEVTATPVDLTLMEAGLRIVETGRGFNRRRQETGFSCILHQVTLDSPRLSAVAACDRMAPSGQVWLAFRMTAR